MSIPQINFEKIAVYDIETLTNLIIFCFFSIKTKKQEMFVIFDKFSEITRFYKFLLLLRKENYSLVGFNCLNFDSQILEFFITNYDIWMEEFKSKKILKTENFRESTGDILGIDETLKEFEALFVRDIAGKIYEHAQYIISLPEDVRFQALIPEWKLNIPHIDLYKQKHYDRPQKATSLKFCQFSIRFNNVQEMPISHETTVTASQIKEIAEYCVNDVLATAAFFEKIKFETELRINLSEKYQINLINASEPRIAKSIFAKFLCEEMQISPKKLRELKTFRQEVDLGEIIFPYIKFETKELQDVLYLMSNAIIFPMGGGYGKDSDNYMFKDSTLKITKDKSRGKINDLTKFEHFFEFAKIPTFLGLGGIHACCESGVYEAKGTGLTIDQKVINEKLKELEVVQGEHWIIHDIDVTSFYPNLAIQNNVKPEQLGESFSKIYEQIFNERTKIPKSDPINYVYKIILNSTYGLSKEINSYLFDPKFTYSITINGQLSILMLVEKLWLNIPNIKIYQENTDGVTIGYAPKYISKVNQICKEWCEKTKLQLEYAFYKKMIIADVNNYIAVYTSKKCKVCNKLPENKDKEVLYNGALINCPLHPEVVLVHKVKKKGLFETELDFHKNASNLIVPKALEQYFVNGIDYKSYIQNHKDFFDFCAAVKKKRDFNLNLKTIENSKEGAIFKYEPQQRVTRFFASKKGGRLVKQYIDGKLAGRDVTIFKDSLITIANKLDDDIIKEHMNNINFKYYIKETEKIIDQINPPSKNQMTLF